MFYKRPQRFLGGLIAFATGDWCSLPWCVWLLVCISLYMLAGVCGCKSISLKETVQYVRVFNDTHLSSDCHMYALSMNLCACVQTITKLCFLPQHALPLSPLREIFLRAFPLLYYLTQNTLDPCGNNCVNQITNHPSYLL